MTTVERMCGATQAEVADWCESAGDFNKIHLDEHYAKQTRFGETIVPGIMALGWVSGCIEQLGQAAGTNAVLISIDTEYLNAIPVGELVAVKVTGNTESDASVVDVSFTAEMGDEVAFRGTASVLLD